MDSNTDWDESRRLASGRVPEGFRPLTLGEPRGYGDMVFDMRANRWVTCGYTWNASSLHRGHFFSATRRPGKPQLELHEDEGG